MDLTSFMVGVFVGALLFDILWRITFALRDNLEKRQREYIDELRKFAGLEP
jgi:hypothetical protein